MVIVAYGYGLQQVNVLIDGLSISVDDEPDIFLDPDITIVLDAESIDITLDPDIDIEVD